MFSKSVFGFLVEDCICVCYGYANEKVVVVNEKEMRKLVDSEQFGLIVKDSLDMYINIAMNRDYNRRQFVTIDGDMLLIGDVSKPGWYLLRPDTIGRVASQLLEDFEGGNDSFHVACSVDGDYFEVNLRSLTHKLCEYWNSNY